ncbi:uncharacterized protein LOC115631417 [Scaptodrosophila lebanonensis]|uniref:Uncharacterized protein LOC115631417 n=1 Tax=Drosophila lebanonensis TaxID=7225 RepID=A0A6J2U8X6_DROLE|nr:uncharacterized protein LOC115631417 [Scaptodrosophila lebanonensis]
MLLKDCLGFAISLWLCAEICFAAVHEDLKCGLSGVYRQRQSVIASPNYPNNYPMNTCLDYVIRSPYRCSTKFHIQFLDFQLELSENCKNDYMAVGLQNDGDDMDVLCGHVVGIKKYRTLDGVLRLRFFTDDSPWTTARGFKLIVTRLACEREDLSRGLDVDVDEEDTVEINSLNPSKKLLSPGIFQPQLFQNVSQQSQHIPQTRPYLNPNTPASALDGIYLPVYGNGLSSLPVSTAQHWQTPGSPLIAQPCINTEQNHQQLRQLQQLQQKLQQDQNQALQQQLSHRPDTSVQLLPPHEVQQLQHQQLPAISDQYLTNAFQPIAPTLKDYDPQSLQQFGGQVDLCCATSFSQAHFYLSSPGFPRTLFANFLPTPQRDCAFYIEKSSPNVCRLRINLKYFDFGQSSEGVGSQSLSPGLPQSLGVQRSCTQDFIEIDGQRYCGCRSGNVHKSYWGEGRKALRMRVGYSGLQSNGFLLEIFQDQDDNGCRDTVPLALGIGGNIAGNVGGNLGGNLGSNFGGNLGGNFVAGFPQFLQQPNVGLWPPRPLWQASGYGYPLQQFQQFPLPLTPYRQGREVAWARGLEAHQPTRVIETNSTHKEFYYYDADEAFARAAATGKRAEQSDGTGSQVNIKAFEQSSCSFDYMEVLKLSVDTLWLTKPLCFAPFRTWLSNIFG